MNETQAEAPVAAPEVTAQPEQAAPATPVAPSLTRQQLEANINVSGSWIAAIRRGTFQGADSLDIANLLGFLLTQHEQAKRQFEAEAFKHPEWGGPKVCDRCKAVAGESNLAHQDKPTEWLCKGCLNAALTNSKPNGLVQ